MRKEYKCTMEESVVANMRLAELTGVVRRQTWLGLWFVPITFVIFFLMVRHGLQAKLMTSGFMSVAVLVVHILTVKDQMRRNIRRVLVRALGTSDPVPCEFEVTEENLIFRRSGLEVRLSWKSVVAVSRTDNAIEVVTKPTALARIPLRIFDNSAESQAWMEFIQEHWSANKTSDASSSGQLR